jgi:hypothetical protein
MEILDEEDLENYKDKNITVNNRKIFHFNKRKK